jgi:hypothetical protein
MAQVGYKLGTEKNSIITIFQSTRDLPLSGKRLEIESNGRYRMPNVVILSQEFLLVQVHSNEGGNSLPRLISHPSIFYSF